MAKERILIVDDEKNIASSLQEILVDEGYEVSSADDGLSALEMVQSDPPDLVLLDIWIPGMDGIEVLKTLKTYHPEIEVLVMSGHGTIDTAVKATKLGAYDFIEKPFSLDELVQSVEKSLNQKSARLHSSSDDDLRRQDLPECFQMMVEVKKAIKNASKNNHPVLILGEAGTGKEFIAQAIHHQSKKANLPFVKMNCAVRPMPAVQAELFAPAGGAHNRKGGRSGTQAKRVVYLKNIEALSRHLQEKLAAALKPGNGRKHNSASELLPSRLFASSTRNLEELVEKGNFNSELYEILKETTVYVAPLRDNAPIIPNLVHKYFEELAEKGEPVCSKISAEALEALCSYSWPENLKELRGVLDQVSRKVASQGEITLHDLPLSIRKPHKVPNITQFDRFESLQEAEKSWEKEFIIHHLRKNRWDLEKTAAAIKTSRQTLQSKMDQHEIKTPTISAQTGDNAQFNQRTLKRSMVLCGSGLHSGIKTGLIMQPLPPDSGILFGDISSGETIPARLDHVQSTDYSTCLKKGFASVATIEHIMAVLHMYRITNLLIKIGDEAPVMDGSARDFCQLVEDAELEIQDETLDEIVIDKMYTFGGEEPGKPKITIEPYDGFKVSYHMEYPEPIGIMDYTYEFTGPESFKNEIAPARTFGFVEEIAMLTKMGFGAGGKLDNFILLGDQKVLNTQLRYEDEFPRHKILDILGDFYLMGRPLRGHIKAYKSGHTQNVGLLKQIQANLYQPAVTH